MVILLPVDGSDASSRTVDHFLRHLEWYKGEVEVHLLNVQPNVAGAFLSRDMVAKFQQEEGMKALRPVMSKLDAAKVKYQRHIGAGDPAETISGYAKEHGCDLVFMGTRGMGSVSNLVLGSVAMKVIHLTPVPVLLVK
ncbi:MAG TPA: universal stress protein [Burkholderiales bacterium]|nr:universal stress protein [Burkholderiales bacterium]